MTNPQAQALLNIVLTASFAFIIYVAIDINRKVDKLVEVYIALEEYESNFREARLEMLQRVESIVKEAEERQSTRAKLQKHILDSNM